MSGNSIKLRHRQLREPAEVDPTPDREQARQRALKPAAAEFSDTTGLRQPPWLAPRCLPRSSLVTRLILSSIHLSDAPLAPLQQRQDEKERAGAWECRVRTAHDCRLSRRGCGGQGAVRESQSIPSGMPEIRPIGRSLIFGQHVPTSRVRGGTTWARPSRPRSPRSSP